MVGLRIRVWTLSVLCSVSATGSAGTIVGSRHDLQSVWQQGYSMPVILNNYGEICVYCHTPHSANAAIAAPLWNRSAPSTAYTLYSSATMDTVVGQPSGVSLACLSCHDGSIGVDQILNAPGSGPNTAGPWYGQSEASGHWVLDGIRRHGSCNLCHYGSYAHDSRTSALTSDLRNDHPISMTFPTPAQDPAFNQPPDLSKGFSDVPLYEGKVECPTCHNVHDPDIAPFLRKSNRNSALCLTCHIH